MFYVLYRIEQTLFRGNVHGVVPLLDELLYDDSAIVNLLSLSVRRFRLPDSFCSREWTRQCCS